MQQIRLFRAENGHIVSEERCQSVQITRPGASPARWRTHSVNLSATPQQETLVYLS